MPLLVALFLVLSPVALSAADVWTRFWDLFHQKAGSHFHSVVHSPGATLVFWADPTDGLRLQIIRGNRMTEGKVLEPFPTKSSNPTSTGGVTFLHAAYSKDTARLYVLVSDKRATSPISFNQELLRLIRFLPNGSKDLDFGERGVLEIPNLEKIEKPSLGLEDKSPQTTPHITYFPALHRPLLVPGRNHLHILFTVFSDAIWDFSLMSRWHKISVPFTPKGTIHEASALLNPKNILEPLQIVHATYDPRTNTLWNYQMRPVGRDQRQTLVPIAVPLDSEENFAPPETPITFPPDDFQGAHHDALFATFGGEKNGTEWQLASQQSASAFRALAFPGSTTYERTERRSTFLPDRQPMEGFMPPMIWVWHRPTGKTGRTWISFEGTRAEYDGSEEAHAAGVFWEPMAAHHAILPHVLGAGCEATTYFQMADPRYIIEALFRRLENVVP